MAYSALANDSIKREQESTTHFHDLLHQQLSADNTRNTDHDSAEESAESPLDFSIKRKSNNKPYDEVSVSDSLSSPASSLNDTGGNLEDHRKNDNEHGGSGGSVRRNLSRDSPPSDNRPNNNINPFFADHIRKRSSSDGGERIGQPKTRSPGSPELPHNINELQMGLSNANMLANSFPAMAALMDPRRLAVSASKGTRPFNAYPKDALALNVASMGVPSYLSSFANFENSVSTQGLSLSSEEIFSIYKQQLMALRERDKYMESIRLSQEHSPSRTSTATSSSPVTSLPPSLSLSSMSSMSMHLSNRKNGINSNYMRDLPMSPHESRSVNHSPTPSLDSNINDNNNYPDSHTPMTSGGRRRPRTLPDEQKDDAYWERRRKNNEAAKRSRDARRAKEDQIAIRAALLEQENLKLRVEVAALKTETAKLRCMLYNS